MYAPLQDLKVGYLVTIDFIPGKAGLLRFSSFSGIRPTAGYEKKVFSHSSRRLM